MSPVEVTCAVVLALCGGYLAYRALAVVLRVHRARRAYPLVPVPPPSSDDWRARCHGALVGLAVGDALGLPAESLPRWLVRLRYPSGPAMRRGIVRFIRRPGDVSDDTQLAICVARSIDDAGIYHHDRFLDELREWYRFRVAAGRACSTAARGLRASNGGESGVPSEGNGAAIRIAPLALAHACDETDASLITDVERNARVTHTTELAVAGAVFVALLVCEALRAPGGSLGRDHLLQLLPRLSVKSGFPIECALQAARSGRPLAEQLRQVGTSGHVVQSVNAVVVVLLDCGLDFAAAMNAIFFAGGDTDSIGAMVGAVIGAQVGISGIPAAWAEQVQHLGYLLALGDQRVGCAARFNQIIQCSQLLAPWRVD